MLTSSTDDGRTWSKAREIPQPDTPNHKYYSPSMEFNKDGVLGLIWHDSPVSDCWYFSASADGGKTFGPVRSLSECSNRSTGGIFDVLLGMWGWTLIPEDQAKPLSFRRALAIKIVSHRNGEWK